MGLIARCLASLPAAALLLLPAAAAAAPTADPLAGGRVSTYAGTLGFGFSGDGGPAVNAELAYPNGLATDTAGNLYIADSSNYRVRRVATDGKITTVAGNGRPGGSGDGRRATSASLYYAHSVAVDLGGNLYVSSVQDDDVTTPVRLVDSAGTIRRFAGTDTPGSSGDGGPASAALLDNPHLVAVDDEGDVYIGEGDRIRKVDPSGTISTLAGQLGFTTALATDHHGNVYVAADNRVRRIDPAGTLTTVAGTGAAGFSGDGGPATAARLNEPGALAVGADGTLYIADMRNHRVRSVDTAGTITTIVGTGKPGFSGHSGPGRRVQLNLPAGLAVGPSGSLFISDVRNNRVLELNPGLTAAEAGACTQEAARAYVERFGLGNAGYLDQPANQVHCGAFLGPGSKAMVVSLTLPSCGVSGGWLVLRSVNGSWRRVSTVANGVTTLRTGAFLSAVGTRIKETRGVLAPGDAHCFPSSYRSRLWHWNGKRLVAGPWQRSGPPDFNA